MSDSSSSLPLARSAPAATAASTPAVALSPGRKRFILATTCATCSLIVLDTNVVAVSLPSIARTFHAGFAAVEWVVSAYMLSFASCLLAMGGLADRFGRKKMLLLGLTVFALASLGCGLATSVGMLNAARAIKGAGAAMLVTAALAVIANTFHEGAERARAWAMWGACMGIATTIAPLVGGAITQWVGWRWIFLLNLPVCAVIATCTAWRVPDSRHEHAGPIDVAGSLLFGCGLAFGTWALIAAEGDGWGSVATVARFAACVGLLVAFVLVERWRAHPMVDLSLFASPRFVAAVLTMFGYAACAQVMMTFLPLYLQNAFGMSAIAAGLGMLPFALAMIAGPFVGARLARRYSSAAVLTWGMLLVGAGNILTACLVGDMRYALVALGMIVTGCGAGILNGDTQKAIMACVPPNRTGMASGISATTRFTAIVTAVGVLGAVLSVRTRIAMDAQLAGNPAAAAHVDAPFMSHVLAGDVVQASASLPAGLREALAAVAKTGFANGFSASLWVAGAVAVTVGLVSARLFRGGRSW